MVTLEYINTTCKIILRKKDITSGELVYLLDGRRKGLVDFLLIDIRESNEHKAFSIDGTDVLFPASKFHLYPEVLEQLRHENFIAYCASGLKTKYLTDMAKKMGFLQYSQLKGGILKFQGNTLKDVAPPNIF